MMYYASAVLQDLGPRSAQEDVAYADDVEGLFAVADGMGASMSGRPAAELAIKTLSENCSSPENLVRAVQMANAEVFARTDAASRYWKDPHRKPVPDSYELTRWLGMGTTLVAVAFERNMATVAHVGDSRAYRFREGKLLRLTRDHRLAEEARLHGMSEKEIEELPKHVITRALGIAAEVEVSVSTIDIWDGDIFLLCSDGLTDTVTDSDIEAVMNAAPSDLNVLSSMLVTFALQHGEPSLDDNISVVLVEIEARLSAF